MRPSLQPVKAARQALDRLIGPDAVDRLEAPIAEAAGLPNAAFTSEEFLELENERIFARTWVLAGFEHDIPEPGDIIPVSVAGAPLLLVRGQDNQIRVFHNACRHRGARLLPDPCRGRNRIACPYHAWTYALDGRLLARPYFAGREARSQSLPAGPELDLVQVRAEIWLDMIFVNLSGDAPPLPVHLQPMITRTEGYDLSALRHAGALSFEVKANWKFACENFIETYHVFAAHPKLARFAPMRTRSPGSYEGRCFFNEYSFPAPEEGRGSGLPYYPNLPKPLRSRGLWFLQFPSLGIEIWPDQFVVFRVLPLTPETTREEIHIYLMADAATAPDYAEARRQVLDMWRTLNNEDVGLLEALQAGRRSASYRGGVYSPFWEEPVRQFSRCIVRSIQADGSA